MPLRRSLLGLIVAALPATVFAQGSVTLLGSVKVGRGNTPNTRVQVILQTSIGLEVVRGFTDEQGKFRFFGLNSGDYVVIAKAPTGSPYKDSSTDLHIDDRPGAQTSNLIVMLEPADLTPEAAKPKPDTVSVEELQKSIPKPAKKLYESGTKAAAAGNAEEAVSLFRKALEIAPDYLFALNDLGSQLLKLDKVDESIQVLRKASTIAPRAYSPRMNLSVALLVSGKPAEAQTEIAAALGVRPNEPGALYVSGQVERALGNRDRAIEVFNRALLNSNGTLVTALIQLGQLYEEKGDDPAAVEAYKTYLGAAPTGPGAEFARSRLEALGANQ